MELIYGGRFVEYFRKYLKLHKATICVTMASQKMEMGRLWGLCKCFTCCLCICREWQFQLLSSNFYLRDRNETGQYFLVPADDFLELRRRRLATLRKPSAVPKWVAAMYGTWVQGLWRWHGYRRRRVLVDSIAAEAPRVAEGDFLGLEFVQGTDFSVTRTSTHVADKDCL